MNFKTKISLIQTSTIDALCPTVKSVCG